MNLIRPNSKSLKFLKIFRLQKKWLAKLSLWPELIFCIKHWPFPCFSTNRAFPLQRGRQGGGGGEALTQIFEEPKGQFRCLKVNTQFIKNEYVLAGSKFYSLFWIILIKIPPVHVKLK